jgi:hypothetical protein
VTRAHIVQRNPFRFQLRGVRCDTVICLVRRGTSLSRRFQVVLQSRAPFSAVQAVYDTLNTLREGVPPRELKNIALPELMRRVTRADDYQQWTNDFLGGLERHSVGTLVKPRLPSSRGAVLTSVTCAPIGPLRPASIIPAPARARRSGSADRRSSERRRDGCAGWSSWKRNSRPHWHLISYPLARITWRQRPRMSARPKPRRIR